MSDQACGIPPNLTAEKINSCPDIDLDPKGVATPECPPLLVKFGEVEVTQEIEFGIDQLVYGGPRAKIRAKKVGAASYTYKYDTPGYHAAALVMVHDYFCTAGEEYVLKPEVKTVKFRSFGGGSEDVKIFKKTPWEFFGYAGSDYSTPMDVRYDVRVAPQFLTEQVKDYSGELRADFYREAEELVKDDIGKLRKQEKSFQSYLDGKLIEYVNYTNTMMVLWSMAAAGNLAFDPLTKKFRIGNDATNPGTTRKIKMVFNLYYKIIKGEIVSNKDTILAPITLKNKSFTESGVGHRKRTCLKCVVVLNDKDTSDNDKGVYFFGLAWGRGNKDATFMKSIKMNEPVYNSLTDRASGKGGFSGDYDKIDKDFATDRGGVGLKTENPDSWVKIYDEDGTPTKAMRRADLIRIIKQEHDYAFGLAAGDGLPGFRTALLRQWSTPTDVKPLKVITPDVKKKPANQGYEITPGLNLFFTAGQNVTSGDIQGCAAQIQIILPLESLAVLGDDDLTFETLPGTLWNIFSTATGVIKIDVIKTTEGTYQVVNMYLKAEALKKEIEEMKKYCEAAKAKMMQLTQDLTNAFNNKDLASYNAALAKMQALANDFANRTGQTIDLTKAYEGGSALKAYIDASNALKNQPVPVPNTSGGTSTPPPLTDPVPESAGLNFNGTPPAVDVGSVESKLVLPGLEVINPSPLGSSTALPVDPIILTPAALPPTVSSGEALGFTGEATNFDDLEGYNNFPPEGVWEQ